MGRAKRELKDIDLSGFDSTFGQLRGSGRPAVESLAKQLLHGDLEDAYIEYYLEQLKSEPLAKHTPVVIEMLQIDQSLLEGFRPETPLSRTTMGKLYFDNYMLRIIRDEERAWAHVSPHLLILAGYYSKQRPELDSDLPLIGGDTHTVRENMFNSIVKDFATDKKESAESFHARLTKDFSPEHLRASSHSNFMFAFRDMMAQAAIDNPASVVGRMLGKDGRRRVGARKDMGGASNIDATSASIRPFEWNDFYLQLLFTGNRENGGKFPNPENSADNPIPDIEYRKKMREQRLGDLLIHHAMMNRGR